LATNQYFRSSYFGTGEQNLLNELQKEVIQRHGYDVMYMPRENVNFDYLFGEDTKSQFDTAIAIECYIKDNRGYTNSGDTLAKFGLDIQDDFTIQIHIDRFEEEVTSEYPQIIRPREGDLIYFGLDKHSIFEISFVDNKTQFFQEGKLYIYTLNLHRFVMGGENIATGNIEIDDIMLYGATTDITLGLLQSTSDEFIVGETVYQSSTGLIIDSTASGEVLTHINNILTIGNVKGVFEGGKNIIGETSTTVYSYPVKSDETFDDTSKNKIADNIKIRKEADDIIDFSEDNPFLDTDYR
jgi:hypothetical protein